LRRRALAERIPLAGNFELTVRCNLSCVHCYQGTRGTRRVQGRELSTLEWQKVIGGAIDAGCLDVLLTGGEPLLRDDFHDIYRYARERGAIVTVFTNGTQLDDLHVKLFRDLPPAKVEISLYGSTREVYERVTGVPGSHAKCLSGVQRLLDGGVETALKTVILRTNEHEVEAMADLARTLGVGFRTDPVVCPQLDGNPAPLVERVHPEVAARLQYADEAKREKVRSYLERARTSSSATTTYRCDAGLLTFYVTAQGRLRPCMMMTDMEFDVMIAGFDAAWHATTTALADPTWVLGDRCRTCPDLLICGFCPGLARLERGTTTLPTEYLCELGRARREVVGANPAMR
jgi:radical SAM protein with 4Fe4S-binding SPASM domain